MKRTTITLSVGLILLAAVGGFFLVGGKQRWKERSDFTNFQSDKNCEPFSQPVVFTAPFTDLSKIAALGVLGGVIGGSPGRSYVSIKNRGEEVPVYNPMEAVLTNIVWSDRGSGVSEYGLYFQAGCNVTYLLDHIDRVTDAVKALAPAKPGQSSATQYGSAPDVLIKAGELLGYSDGTSQAGTFDFLVIDKSKKAYHINENRWKWEQTIYATCPYDYYEENLKSKYYELLGSFENGALIKAENCGSPSQDVAGTASGGWFQGESDTEKGKWLGVGQKFNWAEVAIRENGSKKIFALKEFNVKTTPDKITPGQSVCFQGYENNWAYIKLLSNSQLSLATGAGQCPASFPESQAEIWER